MSRTIRADIYYYSMTRPGLNLDDNRQQLAIPAGGYSAQMCVLRQLEGIGFLQQS